VQPAACVARPWASHASCLVGRRQGRGGHTAGAGRERRACVKVGLVRAMTAVWMVQAVGGVVRLVRGAGARGWCERLMQICGLCSKKCGRWCVVRVVLEEREASLARGVVRIGRGSLRQE